MPSPGLGLPALLEEWQRLRAAHPALQEWTFVLDDRCTRRMGQCRYQKKEISVSRWLGELNGFDHEQAIDTLRHEAAHALAGPGVRHGPVWKSFAVALGARPTATASPHELNFTAPRTRRKRYHYRADCPECGQIFSRRGKPRNGKCCARCFNQRVISGLSRRAAAEATGLVYRKVPGEYGTGDADVR